MLTFLLLYAHDALIPRQRVAGTLWPESGDAQALTNLRRELHHLREHCPELGALVIDEGRTIGWRSSARTHVDLLAFEQLAERGSRGDRTALAEAARLYQGDLLPDCADEWIEVDRTRVRTTAKHLLATMMRTCEQERAYAGAIGYAQHLLRIDSLEEDGWCTLMRCHARCGERAAALHAYQQCTALLKKELGVQPSARTRMAYREVLADDTAGDDAAGQPAVTAVHRPSIYPLVGRAREWRALLDAWNATDGGRPRVIVIRGEAGIGKSRLAEELVEWTRTAGISAVSARCYAGEGRLAYAPVAAWLKSDVMQARLLSLDATLLSDIARLRPELIAARPEVAMPERQLESWQRLRFFDALSSAFVAASPMVLVLDDLQWADAETIEWLQYFARALSGVRGLIVGTLRAEEEHDNAPLQRLLEHLTGEGILTVITLQTLDSVATSELASAVAEQPLDDAAAVLAFQETEGHPLFIIERGRMSASPEGVLRDSPERSRVQSVVAARLARLSPDARAAAEVAAAIGRDFRFDLLAAASDLEETALVRALDELWQRHIVREHSDERWDFSHDRIREVAYAGIGPARLRLIHRRIAQGMELLFAPALDEVSASVAMHLDRGGQPARAIPFLERAASVATRMSASEEAIRCFTHALLLLEKLPAGRDRDTRELALRSDLSVALNSARGYAAAEVEQNLERVFALSRANDREPIPVRWRWVAFTLRFMLGDLQGAREQTELALACAETDPSCRCEAHHAMGGVLMSVGELQESRRHFEAALDAYDEAKPQRSPLGSDLGVFIHGWYSHALWLLGEDAAALQHADAAIALARRLEHPYSETLALAYAALLHQMRRDTDGVLACAESLVALCGRYQFAYYGDWGQVLIGWATGQQRPAEGIERIEAALARLDSRRAHARRPYYMSLLAEICALAGDRTRASSLLDAAITLALERSDLWWLPALYLQKGERERALELSRAQGSRIGDGVRS